MSKTLIALSLIFATFGARAATLEACMVVETVNSTTSPGTQMESNSYDLPDDLSKSVNISSKLAKDLEITLSSGPGIWDSTSHEVFTVVVEINDKVEGTAYKSLAMVINDTGADEIGKNIGTIRYERKNHDVLEVNCAMVDR